MTPDKLQEIADAPGYGTGRAARDRMAAAAEAKALLPDTSWVPEVLAASNSDQRPMAHFGNSGEDGKDWAIYHDWHDCQAWELGGDAKSDAQTVAAIINAYRLGILVRKD